jgi:hypothetical protein
MSLQIPQKNIAGSHKILIGEGIGNDVPKER